MEELEARPTLLHTKTDTLDTNDLAPFGITHIVLQELFPSFPFYIDRVYRSLPGLTYLSYMCSGAMT